MISLALIGKNIQHSKSPEIYKKLFGRDINYSLIDCDTVNDIPLLKDLFNSYSGISITSPYKKYFIDKVEVNSEIAELGGINCLYVDDGKIKGTNTDFIALKEIIDTFILEYSHLHFIILGDGVMSRITQRVLISSGTSFKVLARAEIGEISKLDLTLFDTSSATQTIVINSCSRNFIFEGKLSDNFIFWDYNYNFKAHQMILKSKVKAYIDGMDLLYRQAKWAIEFWNIK